MLDAWYDIGMSKTKTSKAKDKPVDLVRISMLVPLVEKVAWEKAARDQLRSLTMWTRMRLNDAVGVTTTIY